MQTNLKIATVARRNSEKAGEYAYITGALLKKDGTTREVVAMAFGKPYQNLKSQLRKGRTVAMTAEFDGGILRILGRPADPAKIAAKKAAAAETAAAA